MHGHHPHIRRDQHRLRGILPLLWAKAIHVDLVARLDLSAVYRFKEYADQEEEEKLSSRIALKYNLGTKLYTTLTYTLNNNNATNTTSEYLESVYMLTVNTVMW